MNNFSIHQSLLDVIALKTKLKADYGRAQVEREISHSYLDEPRTTFEDKANAIFELELARD